VTSATLLTSEFCFRSRSRMRGWFNGTFITRFPRLYKVKPCFKAAKSGLKRKLSFSAFIASSENFTAAEITLS
jgi:hypothetical protein